MATTTTKVNVWPGYVAAMACLLQSLVLVCGVIALTIFVMTVNKTFKGGASKPGVSSASAKNPPNAPAGAGAGDADANSAVLRVKFLKDDWSIDARAEKAIKAYLVQVAGKPGDGKKVVWINLGASDDPQKARLAYLRVLQVRNLIEQTGVAKSRFEYRILNNTGSANSSDLLYIEPKSDALK